MTANGTSAGPPMRLVRPWIAALLTFLGWGLGFFYARRTKEAVFWAIANIIASIALFAALVASSAYFGLGPPPRAWLSLIPWVAAGLVAMWAWRTAARHEQVEQSGPVRLLGYLGLWLLPIVIAMVVRFGIVQPFRMPSGSMGPTIQVGQYMVVTKWSYGYSRYSFAPLESLFPEGRVMAREPQRGDVVVFRPRPEPDRDFVKRLVGLPGDRIQMVNGVLHINGVAVQRQRIGATLACPDSEYGSGGRPATIYRETLPNGVSYTTCEKGMTELDNTREFVVPSGNYFMMGDDRDNSADSRIPSVVGYVPFDNLVGRVDLIFGAPDYTPSDE